MNWPVLAIVFTGSGIIASVVLLTWLNDKKVIKQQQSDKDNFFISGIIKEGYNRGTACKLYFLNNIKKCLIVKSSFINYYIASPGHIINHIL